MKATSIATAVLLAACGAEPERLALQLRGAADPMLLDGVDTFVFSVEDREGRPLLLRRSSPAAQIQLDSIPYGARLTFRLEGLFRESPIVRGRSCPTDVTEGRPLPAVSIQANGQTTRLPATVGGIVVETASFWVREMRLVADHGREDDRLRIKQRPLDLHSGSSVFRLPDAPPGLYSRLRVDFRSSDQDDDDDDRGPSGQVEGEPTTVRITGRAADGAAFVVQVRDELELDLRAGDGFELAPGKGLTASAHLDLAEWFSGVQLGGRSDEGEERSERLRQNIRRSATLTMRSGPAVAATPAQ